MYFIQSCWSLTLIAGFVVLTNAVPLQYQTLHYHLRVLLALEMSEIFVKTATLDEYAEVVGFAQGENWNFCREDLAIWMKCDRPEAFMVAIKNGNKIKNLVHLNISKMNSFQAK